MRVKISRKEAKESEYWLRLLTETNTSEFSGMNLFQEAQELRKILSKMIVS